MPEISMHISFIFYEISKKFSKLLAIIYPDSARREGDICSVKVDNWK